MKLLKKILFFSLLFCIVCMLIACGDGDGDDKKNDKENNSTYFSSQGLAYKINKDGKTCTIIGIGTCTDSEISIPSKIGNYDVSAIKEGAFNHCTTITKVSIPESVVDIGGIIFNGCENLKQINYSSPYAKGLPFYVKYDHNEGFEFVETIVFDAEILPDRLFYDTPRFQTLILTDNVKSIGNQIFASAHGVDNITISSTVTEIEEDSFSGIKANTVTVSDNNPRFQVKGDCLLDNLSKTLIIGTKNSIIPSDGSVEHIGYAAFATLDIESINLPNTIISIKDSAFLGCSKITSINIPDSVKSIGNYSFYLCSELVSVKLGTGVTNIGEQAFFECEKIAEVINKSSLIITKGDVGNGNIGTHAIEVHTGESKIVNINEYLFYTYSNVNYLLSYIGTDNHISLPTNYYDQNYKIYQYAFANKTNISSVIIPNSVTNIGFSAFDNCTNLENVIIGNSVETIDNSAFQLCDRLTSITIPDSVISIGNSAFQGCTSLSSVTIPDSVTNIGRNAFYGCTNITSVTIGNNVKSIGEYAFSGCSNLTSIKYKGTEEQWNAITKGSSWDSGTGEYTITYNYTGQ